jgi:uncharacterized membrane protein
LSSDDLGCGENKLEAIIGYLLIIGVVSSVILEVIGLTLFYGTYGNLQISENPTFKITGQNFFSFIIQQFGHLFGMQNALVFMTLGLIILLLTPYIRAITSVIYFGWEKNRKYILITLFVLIVLTASLALH